MSNLTKIRKIFPRRVKIKLVLLLVGIIVGAQIETLALGVIQPFILILTDPSIVYTNSTINFVYTLFGFSSVTPFLALLGVAVAFVYIFRGLYIYFFNNIQNRFLARNTVVISNQVMTKTLRQPYLYHTNQNTAALQHVVIRNVDRFFGLINSVSALLVDGFMAIFMLTFLFISSTSMTLVILFFASICIIVYFKIFKAKIKSSGDEEEKGLVQINKSLIQALNGVKEIKIMGREDYFSKKYNEISMNTVKLRVRIQSLRQLPKLFIESLCFSGAFFVVAGTIMAGIDMQALVPQLSLFVLAGFRLLPAISRFVNNVTQVMRVLPSIGQVYSSLFEEDEEYGKLPPEPKVAAISRDIVISEVNFKYPKMKQPVLNSISLTIPQNSSVGIVGPSGAGKSTLVDIVLGILAPQQGSVVYNGKSIHHHFGEWSKQVGYIPQVIYLLDETIMENVAFGIDKEKIDEERVWRALEQAQLKEFVLSLPEGLMTKVGDRGVRLSGGQRQRIGIARVLYNNPPIMVLDEATASLDNKTEKAVMDAIQSLRENRTMIIVAHRLSTIEHCDIVYKVEKGNVTLL